MEESNIPVIDMEKIDCEEGECKKLREACLRWGCFRIINHSISKTLMAEMKKVNEAFEEMGCQQDKDDSISRKSTYEETYNTIINDVTPYFDILPPKKRTMPGRPKKKRRLEEGELKKNDSELRKGGQRKRCTICKQLGHNKKGCLQRPTVQSAEQTEVRQPPPTDVPQTEQTQESTLLGTDLGPQQAKPSQPSTIEVHTHETTMRVSHE
ncbi:hypothetical protein V8G54_015145 [Vigna mungo]|uniref:Non-haem dioxygenase N-terminal domain-containing protein n=1 Tax=Vigna mungo TaxID=3915 RepID=A0AAQ3NKP4_VIGMU